VAAALAAEAADPGPVAEAFGARAERLARSEEAGAQGKCRAAAARSARAAGGYQSRHRLGDPVPGGMTWERAELAFPDPEPSDRTLSSPRRTEARRLPRHAAPSVGLGSRITGFSSRMTGLFAPRALATGARG
jgi:hypothetical protein